MGHELEEAPARAHGGDASHAAAPAVVAEHLLAQAHGDARAFAVALAGLPDGERQAVIAAAHGSAGNAFVDQAVAALAALPATAQTIHTIVDPRALRRDPGNLARPTAEPPIPEGTRVRIVDERAAGGARFVQLVSVAGVELGWTSRDNIDGKRTLGDRYASARSQYVFRAGGKDVMVYLPPGGLGDGAVNVFMFFHGMGGDYQAAHGVTRAGDATDHDNAAIAADIPGAIAAAGNTIGICPAGGANPWLDVKPGDYRAMVEDTLRHLAEERGTGPLTVGHVSLAGHSAGGRALGGAATELQGAHGLDVTDVTLQDAGYNFSNYQASWNSLREWFCLAPGEKTLRVITKNVTGGDTHGVVEAGHQLAADGIAALAAEKKVALTTRPIAGDATVVEGGMYLLGGLEVLRDGAPQGHLRIYGSAVADAMPGDDRAGLDPVAHWKVRNHAMKASATAGPGPDHFGTAARPGPYVVQHSTAPVLDDALQPVRGKTLARGAVVQVTEQRAEGGFAYAHVEGHGWVDLRYLQSTGPAAP